MTPNTLFVDDSTTDDHSTIALSASKMEELGLFNGDTVLLKGKKRKNTVAVVNTDEGVSENKVRMTKVVRSNLRYDIFSAPELKLLKCLQDRLES